MNFFSKNIAPIYIQKCIKTKRETFWVARSHVRQGVTDGTSTHVADLVAIEQQHLQRLVRTTCDEKNHEIS